MHASRDLLDQAHFTTPRLAELERRFIDERPRRQADAAVSVVDRPDVEAALARHPYLGTDQREMVLRLTTGGEQVVPVAAWPGTGKTTALAAAREAWEEAGFEVIGRRHRPHRVRRADRRRGAGDLDPRPAEPRRGMGGRRDRTSPGHGDRRR